MARKNPPTVGQTINFDPYAKLQKSVYKAGPSDMESLITFERALAKGEVMKGRDWDKIAMAVVVIMIGGAVALFIVNEVLGDGVFGFGGGGGGGSETIPAMIYPASTLLAMMFPVLAVLGGKHRKNITVDLEEVAKRFMDDRNSPDFDKHPTSWYLGVTRDDLKGPSERFEAKLQELGADPTKGPYLKDVVEAFGLKFDIMEYMKKLALKRDMGIIIRGMGGETSIKDLSGDRIEEIMANPAKEIMHLQQFKPKDKVLQVVQVLKTHGFKEVSLDTWFAADCLYCRNLEAAAKGLLRDADEGIRAMRGG